MENQLESIIGISKKTADRMKTAGIYSIEKLASMKVEELVKLKGINIKTAVKFIENAKKILNEKESKEKIKYKTNNQVSAEKISGLQEAEQSVVIGYVSDFFSDETVQRIRFLHFKIKHLEEATNKVNGEISLDDLNLISEYIDLLNINYKLKNQNLILRELAITNSYWDPVEDKEIMIYDIMFECARSFWVIAQAYEKLSETYEKLEDYENAIIAMVQCSKTYKAAAHFSAASVNQNEVGTSLLPETLEFKSEQARIFAQNIAAFKEEKLNNLLLASKLYAGVSMLSKRLLYLKKQEEKKEALIKAQFNFDMGKACHLKARALENIMVLDPDSDNKDEEIEYLLKKAIFYFSKAEEIWEDMLETGNDISEKEKENLTFNLSIVNENIMEIDAEVLNFEEIKYIADPDPFIVVPENLAPILPKTTLYLSKFTPLDVNVKLFREYKQKRLKKRYPENKKKELLIKKAGIGRTIKQLKVLFESNDLDINKFVELMEKYKTKIVKIEHALENLDNPVQDDQTKKVKKEKVKKIK
jgi:hypothetical protein